MGPMVDASAVSDRLKATRDAWNGLTGDEGEFARQRDYGRAQWCAEPNWGDWSVPESQVRLLPRSLRGAAAVELGCGTAYFSAWLARAGASPVGVDVSIGQLWLARAFQTEFHTSFPLVCADADDVPFRSGSFDLVLSEYGASSWCDPHRWVPEAARLLRPGGALVFLASSPLLTTCLPVDGGPAEDRLRRDYFGLHEIAIPLFGTTEFQLTYGDWVRVLCRSGFVIDDLTELRPPPTAETPWPFVDAAWASRWPSECVWSAHKALNTP
jgi:SAM-dependent methyltransferase